MAKRKLNKEERKLIAIALQIASDKFKIDARVSAAPSMSRAYMRQSIEAERLAAIMAEADAIVLEVKS